MQKVCPYLVMLCTKGWSQSLLLSLEYLSDCWSLGRVYSCFETAATGDCVICYVKCIVQVHCCVVAMKGLVGLCHCINFNKVQEVSICSSSSAVTKLIKEQLIK